ncbi:MAG TPA: zinc-binding dehydrogenase [Solirubrobacterales bacterium]
MRAALVNRPGPPSVLELAEVPAPECGPGEVLVRVQACGVSSRDIVERNGTYRRDVSYPLIMGLEISGTVAEVGERVEDLRSGDHVCTKAFASCGCCRLCRSGRESTCLRRRPVRGGYGELTAVAADAVVRVPDEIPFEESCTLGPAAGVALNAVRDVARVTVGETVLVTGASGGVGSPAVQLARLAGARVIALTRDPAKEAALRADGAEEVIVQSGGEVAERVRALTGGEGADVVLDTVGSRLFDLCFDSLAVHGRLALVGELFGEEISINPARIFFKRAQLLGVGSVSRAQLEDVVALRAAGRLAVRVAKALPLERVQEAHELVEAAALPGRVVITHRQEEVPR